jgi:hypothetical protein
MSQEKILEILCDGADDADLLKLLLLHSDEILKTQMPFSEGALKERVFEVILQRFETLNFAKIFLKDYTSFSPAQLLNAAGQVCSFLDLTQKHIGNDFPEVGKFALTGIFIKLYPIYIKDETSDLSVLMAELDQILNSLKPFVNLFLLHL